MRRLIIEQWSLGRVVREMGGQLLSSTIDSESPAGVSTDTRTLQPGELFFALRGERFDGHDFIEEAIDTGACAVVVEDASGLESRRCPIIGVDDCIEALGRLGHAIFRAARQEGMHSVAVTGSNGKTTTKELLAAIWGIDATVWATPGNLNNHIGVPLTLCGLPVDCDHLIVEMGANHRGEISELIQLAPADQRIVTSIGRAHLEGFGSMAGVRKAKSEIFEVGERATTAIVPHQERSALIPRDFPGNVITFGDQRGADYRVDATEVIERQGRAAMKVTVCTGRLTRTFLLPLIGRHNAWNLVAALATLGATRTTFDDEAVDEALTGVELPAGRFRIVTHGPLEIMDDAYNANPSSMRASFRAFEQWYSHGEYGPAVAIIGDMLELGDSASKDHRQLASWLADRRCLSTLAFVGDFAEMMAEVATDGRTDQVMVFDDHDEAADWLSELGTARVFLKGSRGNRLERIVEQVQSKL